MDIEKVVSAMRESIDLMLRDHMDMDFSLGEEGVSLTGNEARALLTEIDYWRARCEKAELYITQIGRHGSRIALAEHQAAVAGESDKARYLETLKSQPVE